MSNKIKTEKNGTIPIPFSLYIGEGIESQDFFYCCDEMVNVVLGLSGTTMIQSGETENCLKEGELQVINRLCPFMIQRNETNVFLIFKLDAIYFDRFYSKFSENVYKSNGLAGDRRLWKIIAQIAQILQTPEKNIECI